MSIETERRRKNGKENGYPEPSGWVYSFIEEDEETQATILDEAFELHKAYWYNFKISEEMAATEIDERKDELSKISKDTPEGRKAYMLVVESVFNHAEEVAETEEIDYTHPRENYL